MFFAFAERFCTAQMLLQAAKLRCESVTFPFGFLCISKFKSELTACALRILCIECVSAGVLYEFRLGVSGFEVLTADCGD